MFIKGILKNSSFLVQFCFLIATIFAGSLFSYFLMLTYQIIISLISGFSLEMLVETINDSIMKNGNTIRIFQLFQTLAMFLIPSIFLAMLYSDDEKEYLKIETRVPPSVFALTILSMIAAIPFLNLTIYINEQMKLPEFLGPVETIMRNMEDQAKTATERMLVSDNRYIILLNFLIIAVLAGISEEFMFRGVMQNIFQKLFRNHHAIIWIVAILFSAFHFQFYGFIPRMLLGAYFGYLLYYSKSIWVPILGHFTNNAAILLVYYNYSGGISKINELDMLGTGDTWFYAIISFTVWLVFFMLIIRRCRSYYLTS
jgi:membrane protease YdiL (CAAX protease family)